MKKLIFAFLFLPIGLFAQVDSTEHVQKSLLSFGLGYSASSGGAVSLGLIYKYVGLGFTATLGLAPKTTDPYPSAFLSSASSYSKKYDDGYFSLDLLLCYPIYRDFMIQGSIGRYSHSWTERTTTSDDDGILPTTVSETGSGSYGVGVSWSLGLRYDILSTFMVGVTYSSIRAVLVNFGIAAN